MAERASTRHARGWRRWAVALGVVALAGTGALAPVEVGAADPSADLSVTVTHTPETPTAPTELTVTIAASNAGPDTAEAVVVGLGYPYPLELRTVPAGCRRSASYESVVCELGDVASGATATKDIVLQASGSGLFTLPAVAASDTPDPDSADRSASTSVIVKAGPSQAVRYIQGIVPMILNREAGAATTAYWAPRWQKAYNTYPRRLERIPAGLIASDEYRRIRIRDAYQRILGRVVDAKSLEYWVGKAAGGWSFERIELTLLTSGEFRRKGDLEDQIDRTFMALLSRDASAAELARWSQALRPGGATAWIELPRFLQRTTEYHDITIRQAYVVALNKDPSSLGRYFWLVELRKGTSPEALFAKLLVSNEVLQKYPFTVDDYEEGYEYDVPVSDVQAAVDAGEPAFG